VRFSACGGLTAALTATAPDFGTPPWLIVSPFSRTRASTHCVPAPLIRGSQHG
jgi:hypothetical protein